MTNSLHLFLLGLFACNAVAHPGHNVAEEAAERAEYMKRNPRSLRSCSSELAKRGHAARTLSRREDLLKSVRAKRALAGPVIQRRDFAAYNYTHQSDKDVAFGGDESLLFTDNSSCILQPEVTQGPYYVDGELIRRNVSEDQAGVPLFVDVQIIDTSTCSPVPALYMDFWHCNATGVYSGVSANGNGNSNDTSNIDNTFLRGIQQTDFNGVVQFESIFPGHYTGRATHIHILTHNANGTVVRTNSTLLPEGTNATTHASHVGQLFFDQDLISLVETTEPYASNTQDFTLNSGDMILSQEANSTDPFVEYILLGQDISDGILAWISIGIDPTADNEINAAATMYEDGGVANENSMEGGPGGSGGPGGDGAAPSGMPPGATDAASGSLAVPAATSSSS